MADVSSRKRKFKVVFRGKGWTTYISDATSFGMAANIALAEYVNGRWQPRPVEKGTEVEAAVAAMVSEGKITKADADKYMMKGGRDPALVGQTFIIEVSTDGPDSMRRIFSGECRALRIVTPESVKKVSRCVCKIHPLR